MSEMTRWRDGLITARLTQSQAVWVRAKADTLFSISFSSPRWINRYRKLLLGAMCDLLIKSFLFVFLCFQETENNILDAEPLVGKGVGAALFLASKKGNKLVVF